MLRGIVKRGANSMNTPGSILTARVTDHSSPLTYGYDEITHVFRGSLESSEGAEPNEEAAGKNPPLVLSGGIVSGSDVIDGEPAIVSKEPDDGHAMLFSWNPMHRHVNHHDHAFVYNAILNWNDL